MNLTNDFKRVLSGMLSVAMTATLVQSFPAIAEDAQITKYPYTVFASSDIEGAITVNAGNLCVNGNVATNGTIVASGNMNINGTKTENAGEDMIYIFDKIDSAYFSKSNVNEYSDDYILEEMNINITTPTEIMGEATLTGNININTALKAFENVNLYGEVKNTNDSVIFSKYGDIIIDSQNVNLNGLVYAPFGDVVVTAQNLNLNNVVIIADTITFNCPNVNANYSSSAAEFVGTVSDLLDIPYDEWQYMKDENENDFPDFFEDFDNWSKLKDTDGDKLPDCIEQYIGSDITLVDTDGDALDDFYELFVTYTEPAKDDTDDNGILDCDEDFDKDDLSNLEEYLASTSPWDDDTDSDTLKDGEEIDTYGTDPLKPDTDDDGLEDSDEIHLGTDPANPDTDSDGILDGDEKFYQTYTHIVENEDCVVSEVIVSLEGTGNLQKNTTVKSVMNKDVICTNVAGLVGEPFNIETSSQFDTATITFKIDRSKLGDTEFDNLMFLWYDEENDEFVELETILDEQNSTVSVVTTHFSNYMLVDSKVWFDMWSVDLNYRPSGNDGLNVTYDTVIAIDCSGSMASYDVTGINSKRAQAVMNFIETMGFGDRAGIVMFTSVATVACGLTDSQEALEDGLSDITSSGGTDFNAAIKAAITLFDENDTLPITKRIILLSDGIDTVPYDALNKCKERNIAVYTIRLGSASDSALNTIAEYTGGKFFKAYTTDELLGIYADIGMSGEFDATDTDGDGLYDIFETTGMRMQNGYLGADYEAVTTDKYNPDTDGDGLLDGEEIDPAIRWSEKRYYLAEIGEFVVNREYFFTMYSDPNNPDTDGDGYNDSDDIFPVQYDELNGLIFQSIRKMGIGYEEGCLADDLQCGMYSYSDIFDISWLFKYQLESDEDENIDIFRSDAKLLFAVGNNNDDLIEDLIDKFIYGTGETIEIVTNDGVVDVPVYRSELLQIRYGNDEQVQNYLLSTVDIVKELLAENNGDINAIRSEAQNSILSDKQWDIEFGRDDNEYLFGGMTISVNDLWGSNVSIKDYSCDGNSFSGILHFNLYDHFGLDQPDVEKVYVNVALFRAWFVLQHYEEYNGKYKPFINLVEFDIPFEGVL